jgi:His-Xaa-Ser repeat protein HxsA
MKKKILLTTALSLLGYHMPAIADHNTTYSLDTDKNDGMWQIDYQPKFTLAAHRSHSSHGSHGSHGSHRSSSSTFTPTTPKVTPYSPPKTENYNKDIFKNNSTPDISVLPFSPAISPELKKLYGNTKEFKVLLLKVQTALFAYGYYNGSISGEYSDELSTAISIYQSYKKLKITGNLTDELIASLKITY